MPVQQITMTSELHITGQNIICPVCSGCKATVCPRMQSVVCQGTGQKLRGQWQLQMVPFLFWKEMVSRNSYSSNTRCFQRGMCFESGFGQ